MSVTAKVADTLYLIYQAYGTNGNNRTLNLQLSRQGITDYGGTTEGWQIDILNLRALIEIAEA